MARDCRAIGLPPFPLHDTASNIGLSNKRQDINMNTTQIGFIGGGNMATSLIGGLVADGWPASNIHVSDPDSARRELLNSRFGVHVHDDNLETALAADVLLLSIKPQAMHAVIPPLTEAITRSTCSAFMSGHSGRLITRW